MSQASTTYQAGDRPVASTLKVVVADLLIDDAEHAALEQERDVLEPLGVELVSAVGLDDDGLIAAGQGAIGMLVTYRPIGRRVLASLPKLRVVVKTGIGYNNIDTAAAREHGVWTVNVPDYCGEEVAAHALALVLDGLRAVSFNAGEVRAGRWVKDLGSLGLRRPSTLTVGTVGMGQIARQFHRYVAPLMPSRRYFDPYVASFDGAERAPSLAELFATCDVISLHLPLNAGTTGLVSHAVLRQARPGLILVNTSRADIVDRAAVAAALEDGHLGYFGTDVAWEEPLDATHPDNRRLLADGRAVVTPHMAYHSRESELELRRKAALEIARVVRGEQPLHIVS